MPCCTGLADHYQGLPCCPEPQVLPCCGLCLLTPSVHCHSASHCNSHSTFSPTQPLAISHTYHSLKPATCSLSPTFLSAPPLLKPGDRANDGISRGRSATNSGLNRAGVETSNGLAKGRAGAKKGLDRAGTETSGLGGAAGAGTRGGIGIGNGATNGGFGAAGVGSGGGLRIGGIGAGAGLNIANGAVNGAIGPGWVSSLPVRPPCLPCSLRCFPVLSA